MSPMVATFVLCKLRSNHMGMHVVNGYSACGQTDNTLAARTTLGQQNRSRKRDSNHALTKSKFHLLMSRSVYIVTKQARLSLKYLCPRLIWNTYMKRDTAVTGTPYPLARPTPMYVYMKKALSTADTLWIQSVEHRPSPAGPLNRLESLLLISWCQYYFLEFRRMHCRNSENQFQFPPFFLVSIDAVGLLHRCPARGREQGADLFENIVRYISNYARNKKVVRKYCV